MFCIVLVKAHFTSIGFHGVMVSTQDSESCDPSSNLGGTYNFFQVKSEFSFMIRQHFTVLSKAVIAQLGER